MKYNLDSVYSTNNKLEVVVSQTGSKSMIREKHQDEFTMRQGYRVVVSGETVGFGDWNTSETDLLKDVIKRQRYAHLAYKELYYDLIEKLHSIGLIKANRDD